MFVLVLFHIARSLISWFSILFFYIMAEQSMDDVIMQILLERKARFERFTKHIHIYTQTNTGCGVDGHDPTGMMLY